MTAYLLTNFGGPRSTAEIASFLTELLCDRDVIRTKFPTWIHNYLFGRLARKRAQKVCHDYEKIGGRSPIYFDTEAIKNALAQRLEGPVLTFHRYLPETHEASLKQIETCGAADIRVIPLFPQFCYATTGSIARFFDKRLSRKTLTKLHWIKSFADHPAFIKSWQTRISQFLKEKGLVLEEAALLFSAHGLPQNFIDEGDPYEEDCRRSFSEVLKGFPKSLGRLAYQSKFGPGEWLRPYTDETAADILNWHEGRKNVVFVPITFTSDHIETLFEIEDLYLPLIREKNLNAFRCPALNLEPYWIDSLTAIAQDKNLHSNSKLIRIQ